MARPAWPAFKDMHRNSADIRFLLGSIWSQPEANVSEKQLSLRMLRVWRMIRMLREIHDSKAASSPKAIQKAQL